MLHHNTGVKNPMAKLKPKQVIEIRKKCADGVSKHELAAAYKVTLTNIRRIHERVIWKHLPG